jgi:iron complex transport system substrate-binding protein
MIHTRRRRRAACATCTALLLVTGACRKAAPAEPASAPTRTITDLRGNRVVIPENPTRVALFGGPTGQIAYILGVQDRLCAVTNTLTTSRLISEMDPRMATVPGPRTTNGSINIEELIATAPEFVVAGDIDGDIVKRKTRIPVVNVSDSMGEGHEATIREIRFYGEVFNAKARAERYVEYLQDTVKLLQSRTAAIPEAERVIVYNGYDPSHLVTLGGDTFLDRHIRLAGCRNAAGGVRTVGKREGLHSGLGEVSIEELVHWNPDVVVINSGSPADLAQRPPWKTINAVKNGRVFVQPAGIFVWNRPTMESAVLYPLWLVTKAYPDRFRDLDMRAEIRRFYREICAFNLSDAQVDGILAGEYEARLPGAQP